MIRTNVDEMNVEPIDLRHELRQGVQLRLALAPIVLCPIARELLSRRELHALRCIGDRFPFRPLVACMRLRKSVSSASGTFI